MSTEPPAPQGDYVPGVRNDGVVYTAGMTPRRDGVLTVTGVVGATVTLERAVEAAGLAASNALAALLSMAPRQTVRCLRMTVYVACAPGFTELSAVADGASATITERLGADALPARSAIGVLALPAGAPVEVELTAAVR
ncbi:MAG: RidA family protein [Actinomycetota bacterium]|nr:RidA family protein [Actinomycetota bacterium]